MIEHGLPLRCSIIQGPTRSKYCASSIFEYPGNLSPGGQSILSGLEMTVPSTTLPSVFSRCRLPACGSFALREVGSVRSRSTFLRNDDLPDLPSRFERQTASEASALPASMKGFGRLPLPAAISSMLTTGRDRSIFVGYVSSLPFPTIAMFDEKPVVSVATIAFTILAHTHQPPSCPATLTPRE